MKYLISLLFAFLVLMFMQNSASAATAPDPPANPTATAVAPTQINLFWSAPAYDGGSPITGYKIEYKTGSGAYTVLVQTTGSTSYSHTGLTTDQSYSYKIYTINSVGTSVASSEISAMPTASSAGTSPGAPTGLSAIPVSPTQVNLFWTAPANNGVYAITGYKIEYRVGSGAYTTLISDTASTTTTYSHTGLTTNQVYIYRVYAINSAGTSSPSAEDVAQPTSSSTTSAPGTPTGLSATAVSPTQISLTWVAPTNIGSSPITGYKIEYKSSGAFSVLVANTGTTATTYSHTSLTTGTTYTYKVSAINSVGASTASSEASATPTSSSTSSAPGSPTGLSATIASSSQINLSWSAPTNNGGYPITGYKIEYKIGSGAYSVLVQNTASTTTTYSHTGVTSSQTYVYRVSAINSVGTSSPSVEATATSGSSSPTVPGSPASFSATPAGSTQISLSWSAPSNTGGSAITGYKIEAKKGTGTFETLVSNTQSTSTSFSHTGLTSGTTYYYRVYAVNSVGVGPAAESSAVPKETTTPALSATAISPTSIALTWVAPSQTYKQSIGGYKIEEKIGQDSYTKITDNTGSPATSYTVTGLTTGSTHTYVVSAIFSLGSSPRSNEATATPLSTSTAPPPSQQTSSAPGAPTGLSATAAPSSQINLSWNAPSNSGGSPVVGYKIEVKNGTASYQTLVPSTSNSTTKYSHTKVSSGITYYYRVYAINSGGISAPSPEASATTSSTTAPPPQSTKPPGIPTNFKVALSSPTQANLSWSAPSETVTGYKIEYKIGSDPFRTLVSKTDETSYSHMGLLVNTYTYRVYAINSAGTSLATSEIAIQTAPQETAPEPPKCGPGTVLNSDGVCVVEAEPEPEPETGYEQTHIPGFPDPAREPQYYIARYTSDSAFAEWFDNNFPDQTIYEIVGMAEPEPELEPEPEPPVQCGPGTHLENGVCVLDEKKSLVSGCLIATATYGTELAPQVQQLREIRENSLLATNSGTAFLSGFNDLYYLFSPTVADLERQSPAFKELVRIAITPMLSTMSILNYVDVDSDYEMLGYGIGIILLNITIYLGVPAISILIIKNKFEMY